MIDFAGEVKCDSHKRVVGKTCIKMNLPTEPVTKISHCYHWANPLSFIRR